MSTELPRNHGLADKRSAETSVAWIETGLAIGAIGIGIAVYLLDRGGAVAFVPRPWAASLPVRTVFGASAGSLPSFAHVFAFVLLSTALLQPRSVAAIAGICVSWMLLEMGFELCQLESIGSYIASQAGQLGADTRLSRIVVAYFASGTFSFGDLVSIALGGTGAGLVAYTIRQREG